MHKTTQNMKKVLLTMIFASVCAFASAQKSVVIIDYFTNSSSVSKSDADMLRAKVIDGINAINRVNLIDVESESTLTLEASRRNSEMALEDKTARAGVMKTLGAHYAIYGSVNKMDADYKTSDSGSYYVGNIAYSLTVINLENGTVVGTKSFTYTGLTGNTGSTKNEAVISTLNRVKQSMDNFVNEYFKLNGTIVEMKEANKKGDQAKSLYISLGSDSGMSKGQLLEVFEVKMIAGKEAELSVGNLKVEEVVASDLAECTVTKGGKEIMTAFRAGNELRVKTRKDSGFTSFLNGVADTFK